ncbi:MAG: alpha-galactosidase, partial [Leifsonia sp.]
MLHTFDFDGLRIPANLPGAPSPVPGGFVVPAGPVALLHPFGDTEFYRHGWNSWSPSGWART